MTLTNRFLKPPLSFILNKFQMLIILALLNRFYSIIYKRFIVSENYLQSNRQNVQCHCNSLTDVQISVESYELLLRS